MAEKKHKTIAAESMPALLFPEAVEPSDTQLEEIKPKPVKRKKQPDHNHNGHRARLKKKYLEQGVEALEDHEVLELLLYFGVPYKDTNDTAHVLLQRYGSLGEVLEADYADLQKVNGIGPNSAFLMSFIPQLARRYFTDRWKDRPVFMNMTELAEYVRTLFIGRSKETFLLICLNSKNQVKNVVTVAEGTINEVIVFPSVVVEAALRHKCRSVVLAHNHPGGNLKASSSDIDLTKAIINALDTVHIPVLDHLVVSGSQVLSFAEKGLINSIRNDLKR